MAFAVFAGIVAGSLVAMHAEKSVLWLIIGALVGGLVGYLSVDPIQAMKGVKHGWNSSFGYLQSTGFKSRLYNQRQIDWWRVANGVRSVIMVPVLIATWFVTFDLLSRHISGNSLLNDQGLFLWSIAFSSGISVMVGVINGVLFTPTPVDPKEKLLNFVAYPYNMVIRMGSDASFARKCLLATPPGFALLMSIFFVTLVSVLTCLVCMGVAVAFCFIHSEQRVQASGYSIVGTVTMWWIGASVPVILVGAAVGAILGSALFNLVSVRFIKPAAS